MDKVSASGLPRWVEIAQFPLTRLILLCTSTGVVLLMMAIRRGNIVPVPTKRMA